MPTTYERANKAIEAMVQHALEKYHPELHEEGAIALLPGWENSSGVAVELSLALFLGKAILDAETFAPVAYKPSVRWERV